MFEANFVHVESYQCGIHSQLTHIFHRWRLLDEQCIQLILRSFYIVIMIKHYCNLLVGCLLNWVLRLMFVFSYVL